MKYLCSCNVTKCTTLVLVFSLHQFMTVVFSLQCKLLLSWCVSHSLCLQNSYKTSSGAAHTHLEQYADGGCHAHHADSDHCHLVPAANRLLLHHMADELFLSGHLWK